jgi:DNA-binding NtrC family response regulator
MQALFSEMARAAASEVFVHVAGETGTGKDRVAQALHGRSRRRSARCVAVNASSLSDELFEAELFGHARGAFTGAVAAREGYVAEAEGGTLFIDEVTDLTPRAQAKLLRLLQEREYRRVGETQLRRANVRVITAANVDLEERVAKGLFRQDLMYRIAVVTLRLPPLREREGDLLLLARHFLRTAAIRDGRTPPPLPASLCDALSRYAWPGNVRELENEMARLVALSGGEPLDAALLSSRIGAGRSPRRDSLSLREGLLGFERDFLKDALTRTRGNRSRTAVEIGITRQALLAKMSRYGLA